MNVNPDLIPETDESVDNESIPPETFTKANEVINMDTTGALSVDPDYVPCFIRVTEKIALK